MAIEEASQRRRENLNRLCNELSGFAPATNDTSLLANALAAKLPLAHSTSDEKFLAITKCGYLKSMEMLVAEGIMNHRPECAEVALGTTNSVFFYVGAFCYPHTVIGLLFKTALETDNQAEGAATPFDSGGLQKYYSWPNKPNETARQFFDRHELPIPEYRTYLGQSLATLYQEPQNYLTARELAADPFGLLGGDSMRRRTHEVRIPREVALRSPLLLAVFAPDNRMQAVPEVQELFLWCLQNRVDRRYFESPGADDFSGLRSACLEYLDERIY